jgi:hypothetical protein
VCDIVVVQKLAGCCQRAQAVEHKSAGGSMQTC